MRTAVESASHDSKEVIWGLEAQHEGSQATQRTRTLHISSSKKHVSGFSLGPSYTQKHPTVQVLGRLLMPFVLS